MTPRGFEPVRTRLVASEGTPTAWGGRTVMLQPARCPACNEKREHACSYARCPMKDVA
jgi:hypothetical protein